MKVQDICKILIYECSALISPLAFIKLCPAEKKDYVGAYSKVLLRY